MDRKTRGHLISLAVLLIGVTLSALLFFLNWALGDSHPWVTWMMPLSYALLLGSALIAVLVQLYLRYRLPRRRVIGITMIIAWVALSLLSTVLDTLGSLSLPGSVSLHVSGILTICGTALLVIPGFVLILLPLRHDPPQDD